MYKLITDIDLEHKTVVLIMTCHKFRQAWEPFFTLFKRFWPECPYEVIMCTDVGAYDGVTNITIGHDMQWASNCLYALDRINADRIILFLEDHIPCKPFNNQKIRQFVQLSRDFDVGCLRLFPCPGPDRKWPEHESLGLIDVSAEYRLSLQLAIWKKSTIKGLLRKGDTCWHTEIEGTKRARKTGELFLSVWRGHTPAPYIAPAILKGVWREEGLELLRKENIPMDNITRTVRK